MGLVLPVTQTTKAAKKTAIQHRTPCETCPKAALYPGNRGLHPGNVLPVKLYYLAARHARVGTMDGAYLTWTLDPSHASNTIDQFSSHFPHDLSRENCFEFMMQIDHVATLVQSQREERERDRARLAAKAKKR